MAKEYENIEDTSTSMLSRLALEARAQISAAGTENCHVLIACSKTKGTHRDSARNLYASPLYRKSVLVAESWGLPFSILSAKFGLLEPDDIIEPYDLTLKGATSDFKFNWGRNVISKIESTLRDKTLVLLAGDDYLQPLNLEAASTAIKFYVPMRGLSLGTRLAFLNRCLHLDTRGRSIDQAYQAFGVLSRRYGFSTLREALDSDLPRQGVYFFFDPAEQTSWSKELPRLVRVGTHAVSTGSTATLRTRLRTHMGTQNGQGNHRASVFRLHVGRAIINRENLESAFPNWGKGQSASKEIVEQERPLELRVSEYIGALRTLYIPVDDAAGPNSLRAFIERQFIALFTEDMCPLEVASPSWLGRYSDKTAISSLGLWNVRDAGSKYDHKFMDYFDGLLNRLTKGTGDANPI